MSDGDGDPAGDDDPEEHSGTHPTSRGVPSVCPGPLLGSRGSHSTPAHPYGRCEDCGGSLELGLQGTCCYVCDVEGARTTAAGRRLRERRVPDRRRSREAQRVNQRAVWMLAGYAP